MKIALPDQEYKYVSENSQECDAQTAFVLTTQNMTRYFPTRGAGFKPANIHVSTRFPIHIWPCTKPTFKYFKESNPRYLINLYKKADAKLN